MALSYEQQAARASRADVRAKIDAVVQRELFRALLSGSGPADAPAGATLEERRDAAAARFSFERLVGFFKQFLTPQKTAALIVLADRVVVTPDSLAVADDVAFLALPDATWLAMVAAAAPEASGVTAYDLRRVREAVV